MKRLLIVVVILVALFAVLGAASLAYAQTRTPNRQDDGVARMGWRGGRGPGMMGSDGFGRVPMHPYLVDALAEALDLTPEAVQERLGASETPWEIAVSSGLNEEQARKVLSDAHIAALDAAVADGAISQEQADWIRDRMQWRWENDFEFMQGPCHGGWWGNR